MRVERFVTELDRRIDRHDLLCHPFYEAWGAGRLTREDLRAYAADYYHHVAAFPTYLSALHARLEDGELRRAVLRNLADEEIEGRAHSELWLDFAESMGAGREDVRRSSPSCGVSELMVAFRRMAAEQPVAAALATLYAYESQVPRVAKEKARGLREMYGADQRACAYFDLHVRADVHHSAVWRDLLCELVRHDDAAAETALAAADDAARRLWRALDGIEAERQARRAA
jgi:pyrroloquinoline-quinone synthase